MWIVLAAAADYEAATNWCRAAGSQCTVKHATQSLHENKKRIWLMLKKKQTPIYPFKFICKRLCGFDEFSLFVLVAIFNLKQLCFQLSLKHITQNLKLDGLLANTSPINI